MDNQNNYPQQPAPKKNKILIITIAAVLIVAIITGVAVSLALNKNKSNDSDIDETESVSVSTSADVSTTLTTQPEQSTRSEQSTQPEQPTQPAPVQTGNTINDITAAFENLNAKKMTALSTNSAELFIVNSSMEEHLDNEFYENFADYIKDTGFIGKVTGSTELTADFEFERYNVFLNEIKAANGKINPNTKTVYSLSGTNGKSLYDDESEKSEAFEALDYFKSVYRTADSTSQLKDVVLVVYDNIQTYSSDDYDIGLSIIETDKGFFLVGVFCH